MRAFGFRLLLVFLLSAAVEPAAAQSWGLPQLMGEFAEIKQSTARFVERRTLSVLKTPLESSGVLVFVAPRYLERDTQQPERERLVVEGDRLTVEKDGGRRSVSRDEFPQLWGFIEGIRATLAGDLASLQGVYTVNLTGTDAEWQMALQPRDPQMQEVVKSIRFAGSGPHIKSIVTEERDGDRTEMWITERTP